MPADLKKPNSSGKTSDELVAELLETVRKRDKTLERAEKEKKHRKHKKEKKKKHRHRSRSKEKKKSRKRSRSRSKERKKEKKRRRSASRSSAGNDEPTRKTRRDDDRRTPEPSCSRAQAEDVDDDLPMGADFQTVLEEARKPPSGSDLPPLDLSSLPCEPGQSHRKTDSANFKLSKDRQKDDDPPKKVESEVLKKVIESKGPADFVPRKLKIKGKEKADEAPVSPRTSSPINVQPKAIFFNIKFPPTVHFEDRSPVILEEKPKAPAKEKPKETKVQKMEERVKEPEPLRVDEYGPAPPEPVAVPLESVERDEKKQEESKSFPKDSNDWEFIIKPLETSEKTTEKKAKKEGDDKMKKESKSHKKSRSRSPEKGKKEKKRSRSKEKRHSRSKERTSSRSSKHSKSREKRKEKSRSRSRERRRRSRSRGASRRSRSRSRDWSDRNGRERQRRRSWSRGRRSRSRSRSREDNRIDKAKLLQIAKKRRAAGIFDIGDDNPKSVEDFVSYCEKLQRRQDREDRRERGEVVSDGESEIAAPTFKHPYKPAAPDTIKINIVNSVPLPTKSTEECILDTAALRVVYPVSSGSVHRESMEWQKVEKEAPLMTASTEQKKFKALTSMDAEKVRQKAKALEQPPAFLLPPPPAPPALPPPPLPPIITAQDTLLPPPPPMPATLVVPSADKMIMKEPEQISTVPPKNVAEVLAKRAKAQTRLKDDPNDFHAMRDLKEANEQMNAWAAVKSLPGKYTGTTGVDILPADALQPHDPRYNAWIRKDMFKRLAPNFGSGIGLRMMQRMGWQPGTGLGREGTGSVEPLTLDVKNDRKGLATDEDLPARNARNLKNVVGTDLSGKHPVSLVMELCAKRKWQSPVFTCHESGPPHQREFIWKVVVNGVEYCSATSSKNKKDGKSVACQIVLQSMGLVPRDPTLPVII